MQLQIETTNVCNADCVFCPYSSMTRVKGTMPMDLFTRIIDQAAAIPAIDKVTLTGLGEPLLDRFIVERIRTIKARMPKALIDLYTNGSYLRPALVEQLVDAGLGMLYVSLNAVSATARQQVMKVDDYDQVVDYITQAITIAGERCRVIVKGISSKDLMEMGDPSRFIEMWKGSHDDGGHAFLHLEGNWAGSVGAPIRLKPTESCPRALGQIMVLVDGRVSLCCFDAHGDVILGDLRTQTLRDIYNGEPALGIRIAHQEGRRGELQLCGTCTGI